MLNGGGWGHEVGMAALLRERGYLLEEAEERERRPVEARLASGERGPARDRSRALRLAVAGLALLLRVGPRW